MSSAHYRSRQVNMKEPLSTRPFVWVLALLAAHACGTSDEGAGPRPTQGAGGSGPTGTTQGSGGSVTSASVTSGGGTSTGAAAGVGGEGGASTSGGAAGVVDAGGAGGIVDAGPDAREGGDGAS